MELAAFAALLAGVSLVVGRELLTTSPRFQFAPPLIAGVAAAGLLLAACLAARGEEDQAQKAPAATSAVKPAVKKLVKPKGWPADHPLPLVGSNCAACHLTAGRELTAAVVNFVRSTHDLQKMTCYDCHGGNTADDVKAHEEAFGFIGTKKSAHIQGCSDCHTEPAEELAAGPHHWDFSKRINTEYPLCFDCHGNHDIGNPPADFRLAAMCGDCHDEPAKEFPNLNSVVLENDKLWETMGKVRRKRIHETSPLPEEFAKEVAELRHQTMHVVHTSEEITAEQAAKVNQRAAALRGGLDKWLQSNPQRNSRPGPSPGDSSCRSTLSVLIAAGFCASSAALRLPRDYPAGCCCRSWLSAKRPLGRRAPTWELPAVRTWKKRCARRSSFPAVWTSSRKARRC